MEQETKADRRFGPRLAPEGFYSFADLCRRLNRSKPTMRKILDRGAGPPSARLGDAEIFPVAETERWLAGLAQDKGKRPSAESKRAHRAEVLGKERPNTARDSAHRAERQQPRVRRRA